MCPYSMQNHKLQLNVGEIVPVFAPELRLFKKYKMAQFNFELSHFYIFLFLLVVLKI